MYKKRLPIVYCVVVVLIIAPLFLNDFLTVIATRMLILALLAISLIMLGLFWNNDIWAGVIFWHGWICGGVFREQDRLCPDMGCDPYWHNNGCVCIFSAGVAIITG